MPFLHKVFAAVSIGKEGDTFHYRLGWVGQDERMCERVFGKAKESK